MAPAVIVDTYHHESEIYPQHLLGPNVYLYIKRTPHCIVFRVFTEEPDKIMLKCAPHEKVEVLKVAVDYFEGAELDGFH